MTSVPDVILVSGYPPNAVFGGGLVLKGLLSSYPPERLTIVTNGAVLAALASLGADAGLLSVRHVPVHPWRAQQRGIRRLLRTLNGLKLVAAAHEVAALVRQDGVILAVPWGGELGAELFVGAFLAHRLTGAPLVLYELDEWRASIGSSSGFLARFLECVAHGPMAREAVSVWAMSDALASMLGHRFGVDAEVLPHCIDIGRYPPRTGERHNDTAFRVLYTGAVYGAQADAIAGVARALRKLPTSFEMVIHTSESSETLARFGIVGDRVSTEPPVSQGALPETLQAGDALLLPFSFAAAQRDVVSTSFPTKTVDYLASGVPVLVHAPPYSTIARQAAAEGWGLVVSEQSETSLARALERLANDLELRRNLVARAREIVYSRHDSHLRARRFLDTMRMARRCGESQPRRQGP